MFFFFSQKQSLNHCRFHHHYVLHFHVFSQNFSFHSCSLLCCRGFHSVDQIFCNIASAFSYDKSYFLTFLHYFHVKSPQVDSYFTPHLSSPPDLDPDKHDSHNQGFQPSAGILGRRIATLSDGQKTGDQKGDQGNLSFPCPM